MEMADKLKQLRGIDERIADLQHAADVARRNIGKAGAVREIDEIESQIDELIDIRVDAMRAIHTLERADVRKIMRLRYLHGMSWREIARAVNYSESEVFRLHRNAMKKMCG